MPCAGNPDQPGEEKIAQGDHDASPNTENIESSEKVQKTKTSEQRTGGNDAESEEKETDEAGAPTRVVASSSSDGGGRAPIASVGAAAPPLQRQASNYGVPQTDEEVRELENMIKAIAPTPRKAKRVYNMYVTREEELGVCILRHRTVGQLPPMMVALTLIQLPIRLDLR